MEPLIRAAELPFVAFGEKDSPSTLSENFKRRLTQLSKLQGEDAMRLVIEILRTRTEAMLHSLPTILPEEGVDALVIDTYQFYLELGPIRLGMPYIHVSLTRG